MTDEGTVIIESETNPPAPQAADDGQVYRIGMNKVDLWTLEFLGGFLLFLILLCIVTNTRWAPYLLAWGVMAGIVLLAFFYKYWFQIPSRITFDPEGMMMLFRGGKKRKLLWWEVSSLYVTKRPGYTTGDGMVYLKDDTFIELSYEVATKFRSRYELAKGIPPLENDGSGIKTKEGYGRIIRPPETKNGQP